jgi:hypothetical protein
MQTFRRLHRKDKDPIFYGRTLANRFDSPNQSFGVLYIASDVHCAFIETFGQATGIHSVTENDLRDRSLAELRPLRAMRLIDLASSGALARIGADSRLFSGSHAVAQRWSAALRAHPLQPDGILYPARHDPPRTACAIFEPPATLFEVAAKGCLLDTVNQHLLGEILDLYDFSLNT